MYHGNGSGCLNDWRPVCRLDFQAASSDDDEGSQPQFNLRRYPPYIPIATEAALQRPMFKLLARGRIPAST
jgi:hypothetical protein